MQAGNVSSNSSQNNLMLIEGVRDQSENSKLVQFPGELWQMIGEYLPLRDAVRTKASCKSLTVYLHSQTKRKELLHYLDKLKHGPITSATLQHNFDTLFEQVVKKDAQGNYELNKIDRMHVLAAIAPLIRYSSTKLENFVAILNEIDPFSHGDFKSQEAAARVLSAALVGYGYGWSKNSEHDDKEGVEIYQLVMQRLPLFAHNQHRLMIHKAIMQQLPHFSEAHRIQGTEEEKKHWSTYLVKLGELIQSANSESEAASMLSVFAATIRQFPMQIRKDCCRKVLTEASQFADVVNRRMAVIPLISQIPYLALPNEVVTQMVNAVLGYFVRPGSSSEFEQLDSHDSAGATLVHHAVAGNSHLLVQFLLQKGGMLEAIDNEGQTPLHWAINHGHLDLAQELANMGANLNHVAHYGETALLMAINNRDPEANPGDVENFVSYLLEKQVDCNNVRADGKTPVRCAAMYSRNEALSRLLEHEGVDTSGVTEEDMEAEMEYHLEHALISANYHLLNFCIEKGADVNFRFEQTGRTLLQALIDNDSFPDSDQMMVPVNFLLTHGVNVNDLDAEEENTALTLALTTCSWEVAKALLKAGAIVRNGAADALAVEELDDAPEEIRALLEKYAAAQADSEIEQPKKKRRLA